MKEGFMDELDFEHSFEDREFECIQVWLDYI